MAQTQPVDSRWSSGVHRETARHAAYALRRRRARRGCIVKAEPIAMARSAKTTRSSKAHQLTLRTAAAERTVATQRVSARHAHAKVASASSA